MGMGLFGIFGGLVLLTWKDYVLRSYLVWYQYDVALP